MTLVPSSQSPTTLEHLLLQELASRLQPDVALVDSRRQWAPYPHQVPPDGDWRFWLCEGGRGSGKTDAMSKWLDDHVNGPSCIPRVAGGHRVGIIGPTLGDTVESCVNGPSGLVAHNPNIKLRQTAGGTFVRWPSGAEGKIFGAFTPQDVERLRAGGNRCAVWAEELAAWVQLKGAWDQMRFGTRLGARPRVVISTTPKPRKDYLEIRARPDLTRTGAPTSVNAHLDPAVRAELYETYGGTRLGQQELDAKILTDVPGALWSQALLEDRRAPPTDLVRIAVALDVSGGKEAVNAEQGLVACGKGVDARGYVLADRTCKLSPDGWARRTLQLYLDVQADVIVVERNFGGDMIEAVLRSTIEAMRQEGVEGLEVVKIVDVVASRGKQVRAAPVSALYEQHRVSHCGVFSELEEELVTWTPESGVSPNRLDALVWALTYLIVKSKSAYVY